MITKLSTITVLTILVLPVMAETYKWVDEKGTAHFTDDYSKIPQKYHNKVKELEEGKEYKEKGAESGKEIVENSKVTAGNKNEDGPRPILYFDSDEKEYIVIKGVYSDGSKIKIPVKLDEMPFTTPIWSPDGTQFVLTTEKTLLLMNLKGTPRKIFAAEKESISTYPIWSPDGERIAIILSGETPSVLKVAIIDVATQNIRSRYNLPFNISPNKFKWSPDGRKVLLAGKIAVVVDVLTGGAETIANRPVLAEWGPQSDAVYYFNLESPQSVFAPSDLGAFYFKKLGSTSPVKLMDKQQIKALGLSGEQTYGFMALSPKGSKLAIAGSSLIKEGEVVKGAGIVNIYDLHKSPIVALDKPSKRFHTEEMFTAIDWAPDENSLAILSADKDGLIIKLLELGAGGWRTLANVTGNEILGALWALPGFKAMSWTQ